MPIIHTSYTGKTLLESGAMGYAEAKYSGCLWLYGELRHEKNERKKG